MGAISFNLDQRLVHELRRHLPLNLFVETGTFRGESLAAVQSLFDRCITIELSEEYYDAARLRFAEASHISVLRGDSAQVLAENRGLFEGQSALFWLDAHWCAAEDTAGEKSQCPLLHELGAIGRLRPDSVLLIDDARLFLCPPPKPHEISDWPDLGAIIQGLQSLSDRHALACFNDVLIFAPREILAKMRPFLSEHTFNLLTLADKARDYDTLLTQARQKEAEIAQKQAALLQQESEMKRKDAEIVHLAAAAAERLDVIQRLDLAVKQSHQALAELGRDPTQGGLDRTPLTEEVAALRIRLAEVSRQLGHRQLQLQKLELEAAARAPRKGTVSAWQRVLRHWEVRLAANTVYPLAKLQQYAPRPLQRESFPRRRNPAKWPRICLATPSYQQAPFLERTIASVLDQEYSNLAYGVQDGGSTDGSAEIITRHVPRLAHAESAPDRGQSDAIRRGFAKLYPRSQDIMGWLNSDDVLMPGALHYVGAYFARHPEVDVIYGHRVIIDEQDREVGRWFLPPHHADTLRWFDLVPQETLFWRAHCYQEIGGLDESFQFAMDWDLLLRFEQAGCNIRRLPYFLGCFRVHEAQKTSAKIHSIGEQEMERLRERTHGRKVTSTEVHKHLTHEIQRSAMVEWLHRHGIRY